MPNPNLDTINTNGFDSFEKTSARLWIRWTKKINTSDMKVIHLLNLDKNFRKNIMLVVIFIFPIVFGGFHPSGWSRKRFNWNLSGFGFKISAKLVANRLEFRKIILVWSFCRENFENRPNLFIHLNIYDIQDLWYFKWCLDI